MDDVSYSWKIEPSSAGQIESYSDTAIAIYWAPAFYGAVELSVHAVNENEAGEWSEPLLISIIQLPVIESITGKNTICGNHKNIMYSVTPVNPDYIYQWDADNNEMITILGAQSEATLTVKKFNNPSLDVSFVNIKVTAKDIGSPCESNNTLKITILHDNAPTLNKIVSKNEKSGTPYMLIYPNPETDYIYQWQENGRDIVGATEQFYYPKNYGATLKKDATYRLFVAEAHSKICGCYTDVYELSPSNLSPAGYITVHPNPVTDGVFTVSFNPDFIQDNSNHYLLTIYTFVGEKIWEQKMNGMDDILISKQMNKGIYFITLTSEKQQYTEKIIIQ
jgi:hypothetical protein